MNADFYREVENLMDEYESVFGLEELQATMIASGIEQTPDSYRRHLSYMIRELEILEFTRGVTAATFEDQKSLREALQPIPNLMEETPMTEQVATPNPLRGADVITGPSTPSAPASEYGFLRRLIDTCWARPMTVVGGPTTGPQDNLVMRPVAPQDQELLDRTSHVRLKGEKLLQFYARVGLGPAQIRTMSRAEIKRFVDIAEENAEQQPKFFEPTPLPQKIRLI